MTSISPFLRQVHVGQVRANDGLATGGLFAIRLYWSTVGQNRPPCCLVGRKELAPANVSLREKEQ
jgi:hypothetical protein